MRYIRRQSIRCPLCEKGRVIDVGPEGRINQFILYGPQNIQHAQLIAKCPNCGSQIGITLSDSKFEVYMV